MGGTSESLATRAATELSPAPTARSVAVRILRASSVYGLANLGIRALNLLLLPVYTRFLTPSDYGTIALAETLALSLVTVVSLGFNASIQRLYFQHVDDPAMLSAYVGSTLKFALVLEFGFLVVALTAGPGLQRAILPSVAVPFRYIAMAMVTAAATQFFSYRLMLCQAEHRPWTYATLSVLSFGLTASLSIVLLVFVRQGVMGML